MARQGPRMVISTIEPRRSRELRRTVRILPLRRVSRREAETGMTALGMHRGAVRVGALIAEAANVGSGGGTTSAGGSAIWDGRWTIVLPGRLTSGAGPLGGFG